MGMASLLPPTMHAHHAWPAMHACCTAHARTFGSCTKLCPDLVLGGISPVHACFRHSMMVCNWNQVQMSYACVQGGEGRRAACMPCRGIIACCSQAPHGARQPLSDPVAGLTVLPAPLWPTMRVRGL